MNNFRFIFIIFGWGFLGSLVLCSSACGPVEEDDLGKHHNFILSSTDGRSWKRVTSKAGFGSRHGHSSVVFNDKLFVIGGDTDLRRFGKQEEWHKRFNSLHRDIWVSDNGLDWEELVPAAPFTAREFHRTAVLNGTLFLVGGVSDRHTAEKDVWQTTNGEDWSLATDQAEFSNRVGHTVTTFNNKLWLIAGQQSRSWDTSNDVWYSEDGKSWTKASDHFPFLGRVFHSTFVFDNKLWIVGGYHKHGSNSKIRLMDVWNSEDGIDWFQQEDNIDVYQGRQRNPIVVFQDVLWLFEFRKQARIFRSFDGEIWNISSENKKFGAMDALEYNGKIWIIGGIY